MVNPTWKIIDRGAVPLQGVTVVDYDCGVCGASAGLPVLGIPIAQIGQGIVFDIGAHAMPRTIECRRCRRRFSMGDS